MAEGDGCEMKPRMLLVPFPALHKELCFVFTTILRYIFHNTRECMNFRHRIVPEAFLPYIVLFGKEDHGGKKDVEGHKRVTCQSSWMGI